MTTNHLTVRDLRGLLEQIDHAIAGEGYIADVHQDVKREITEWRIFVDRIVGSSHMGCALDHVMLQNGDDDSLPIGGRKTYEDGQATAKVASASSLAADIHGNRLTLAHRSYLAGLRDGLYAWLGRVNDELARVEELAGPR